MPKNFKYFAFVTTILCFGCQNAGARGYVSPQGQTPSAIVVEEVQVVENVPSSDSSSGIWDKTKEVSSDVWDGTKKVTDDVWDGTKKVSSDVWDGAKDVGSDIKDAVTDDTHSSAD